MCGLWGNLKMNVKDIIESGSSTPSSSIEAEHVGGFEQDNRPSRGLSFFKVQSLDKPIEEYLNHPLNIAKDEDFGQGLRGLEAYLGNTNLAVIDLFGFVKYFLKNKPKKVEVENVDSQSQVM